MHSNGRECAVNICGDSFQYVATEVHFALEQLSVSLHSPANQPSTSSSMSQLLKVAVSDVRADINQRPEGNAVL